MYRGQNVTVYFPCRNEAAHLAQILPKIPKFVDEILLVSNNSTDNTVEVARKLGFKVFEDNRVDQNGIGYGFAHMTALAKATGDIIVSADADGTYPIETLDTILDYFLDNHLDFVSCSRYPVRSNTKIPWPIQLGVQGLNLEFRLLYGPKIADILSGMWILTNTLAKTLPLNQGGWNLSPQIKILALTHPEIKFKEYNIVQYSRFGDSHMKYIQVGLQHFWWILKTRFTLHLELKKIVLNQLQTNIQSFAGK